MACLCGDPLERELARRDHQIDGLLKKDKQKQKEEIRILLLGPGESGKSTIFKQMKILNDGYSQDECISFRQIVYTNILSQMKVLCNASVRLRIPLENNDNVELLKRMLTVAAHGDSWNPQLAEDVAKLWADGGIRSTFENKDKKFQLNDSAEYFFDNLARINKPDYIPSEQDILHARIRSTGIEEAPFVFGELAFRLIDVGGQRNERRKWIHCFDSVTCVLFVIGLSEYDQVLREDETQNRMKESLLLFDEICNSPWFRRVHMVLFLNKQDIFKAKLKKSALSDCFPDFAGGNSFDQGTKFVEKKFLELNRNRERTIYPHLTCAVDTKNVRHVFNDVKGMLLREVFKQINM